MSALHPFWKRDRGARPPSPAAAAVVLVLLVALAACRELLVQPADAGPAGLSVSYLLSAVPPEGAAEAGAAFDKADGVRIRLVRQGTGTTVVDEERSFQSQGSETRLRVVVDVEGEEETFDLALVLTWQGETLFEGGRSVTLASGEETQAEVPLVPVAAGIAVAQETVLLQSLGEETQLEAAVVFATGDAVPGQTPAWSTLDPEVVEVTPAGRVTALAEGEARVVASHGSHSRQVTVQVHQAVASVAVSPPAAVLGLGQTVQLEAALADANGNPIDPEGRSISWSSSNTEVATVSTDGLVTGQDQGEATITASAEGNTGQASITVSTTADDVEGVWQFREEDVDGDLQYLVIEPTDMFIFLFVDFEPCWFYGRWELVGMDGDIRIYEPRENADDGELRLRFTLESPEVLFIESLTDDDALYLDATSLTRDDFQPVCSFGQAEAPAGMPGRGHR